MTDAYLTVEKSGESTYTESRSRFIAFASHIENEQEAKNFVAALRKKYYDARHICYAYALGNEGEQTRQNDDGEPAGTAGAPLGRQLRSRNVTYAIVAVIRYFGGVKLGVSRLGAAYKTAASEALSDAQIGERLVMDTINITVPYADVDMAMRFVKEFGAEIAGRAYTETGVSLQIKIRLRDGEALRQRFSKVLSLRIVENEDGQ